MAELFRPSPPPDAQAAERPLWQKLAWFAGLMLAGLMAVAGAAYAMRTILFIAS